MLTKAQHEVHSHSYMSECMHMYTLLYLAFVCVWVTSNCKPLYYVLCVRVVQIAVLKRGLTSKGLLPAPGPGPGGGMPGQSFEGALLLREREEELEVAHDQIKGLRGKLHVRNH